MEHASLSPNTGGDTSSEQEAPAMHSDVAAASTPGGEVRYDTAAAADDFGHLVHRTPRHVVRPRSADDVATAIRAARSLGAEVAAQGSRHSVWGRSQVADGVVLDMTSLARVSSVGADRVTVDAGATWSDVLTATLPHGVAPPVVPEYLGLSVGGTLAVGGVGGTTWMFGVVSDTVLELDVVTGRGEQLTCSPTRNADLFDVVRAGLGQVGIVTRATVRCVPAPPMVRRFLLFYPDLAAMLRDARLLTQEGRFDGVKGAIVATPGGGWSFQLDVATGFAGRAPDDGVLLSGLSDDAAQRQATSTSYLDHLGRLASLEKALRAEGLWAFPHPWLTTFVGDSAVEAVVMSEVGRLDASADLGRFGQVVLSPIRTQAIGSPLLRLPAEPLCHAVNLIRFPEADDTAAADRLVAANKTVYQRIRHAGGTLYPASAACPLSPAEWRDHFGPVWGLLREAKERFDPDLLLTPGYEIFAGRAQGGGQ
jgi:FAD/FMN-containing dehydrogenase